MVQFVQARAHPTFQRAGLLLRVGAFAELGTDAFEAFEVVGYRCGGVCGRVFVCARFVAVVVSCGEVRGGCLGGNVAVEELRWVGGDGLGVRGG